MQGNILQHVRHEMAASEGVENARYADEIRTSWVAGGLGFEPRLTESESAVLPLNYPPIGKSNQIRSGMDQASQAGPGSLATAADRRRPMQRAHIYGISRRFPSGVDKGAQQALCAAAAGRRCARCAEAARLSA